MPGQFCFNDLSPIPYCKDVKEIEERVSLFVATIKESATSLGLKKIRYSGTLDKVPLSMEITLQDFCNSNVRDPKSILLLSTHTMPQVDDENDDILSNFFDTSTKIVIEGQETPADGFNAGFCQRVPCIGFASIFWRKNAVYEIAVSIGKRLSHIKWGCLSIPEHVRCHSFLDWFSSITPINLVPSSLNPNQKSIKLRADHGCDILYKHANSLVNCSYVDGIVNSLPFKPHSKFYINKIHPEGLVGVVDIVLFWYDKGYSMRVKTTGRNFWESQKIALLIREKYGH